MKKKINYLADIKVMSSFRQVIAALGMIINVVKVLAFAFLVLQTIVVITQDDA